MSIDNVTIRAGGGAVVCEEHDIKAGETIGDGDFVCLHLDRTISEATATSAAIYGRARALLGSTTRMRVEKALPDTLFAVTADASAAAAGGKLVDLVANVTTGEHQADIGASAVGIFQVGQVIPWVLQVANTTGIYVSVPAGKSQAMGVAALA